MANWRGTWASGTAYIADDSVTYGGVTYFCVTANTGQTPGTGADWALLNSFTGPGAANSIEGVTVSGTPSSGKVITATSATAANWATPAAGVVLDAIAGDIAALGTQYQGGIGKAADAGHVHPTTGVVLTSSFPLNQSTTGNAATATTAGNVTGTVAIGNGGTGQIAQQAAIDALTGTQSAGKVLRSDGTHAILAAIQAGDVPALSYDAAGAAAAAQSAAQAASLPLGGGTMSGAIAMGTSKVTGVGNASGAQDVAAFGQIPTA